MHTKSLVWRPSTGWLDAVEATGAHLIIYFGNRAILADGACYNELRTKFPDAHLLGCTTGGQIHERDVDDGEVNAIALSFAATRIAVASETITGSQDSHRCGTAIGQKLAARDLAGVFVLSDGLNVNGSELVAGINSEIGDVSITGGLAGDGAEFGETLVGVDSAPKSHNVAAVGFYGSAIKIGHGSAGGWDVFGPRRIVTRSQGNILYELDNEPALDLYERYLGEEEARALPGSALLFPLEIFDPKRPDHRVVRTVLAIDREAKTMTFAGDIPQGWMAQLMRGNFARLAQGAAFAARQAREGLGACKDNDGIAILVSCIGRRLLMGQRVIEEVEAAGEELGAKLMPFGFYSYGEISPHAESGICELHNQTMTVTTITEAA